MVMLLLTGFLSVASFVLVARAQEEPIKIGVIGPMNFIQGQGMWEGATLAAEEINATGGINVSGVLRPIELYSGMEYVYPDNYNASRAEMERLITDVGVNFVVGGFSTGNVFAMRQVAMNNKTIFILTGSASNELIDCNNAFDPDGLGPIPPGPCLNYTGGCVRCNYTRYKYMFRVTPVNGSLIAKSLWAFNRFVLEDILLPIYGEYLWPDAPNKQVKVAVVSENLAWANVLHWYMTNQSVYPNPQVLGPYANVTYSARLPWNGTDFSAYLTAIRNSGARLIIHLFVAEAGRTFIKQWGDMEIEAVPVGIDVISTRSEMWNYTSGKCEYETFLAPSGKRTPITNLSIPFWDAYVSMWGHDPIYSAFGAYNAMYTLKEAIERAGTTDSDAVVTELEKTDRISTTGKFKFTGPQLMNFSSPTEEAYQYAPYLKADGTSGRVNYTTPAYAWSNYTAAYNATWTNGTHGALDVNPTAMGTLHDVYSPSWGSTWTDGYVRPFVCQWQTGRLEVIWPADQPYSKAFKLPVHSTRYPWSMFRHDLERTGYTESPTPNTNQTVWNYTTEGAVDSSPAVADSKVYIGSSDYKVYCLNALTGTRIWNYTTGAGVGSSPAVAYDKVFVGSDKIYCLNASTGAYIWSYTTGSSLDSSPAVADGKVFVGSYDNKVYCLNALTGAQIWNYTTSAQVISSPAVADGKVFVGSYDNKVYCLNALTGIHIWNYTTGGYVESSPAVVDGKVYVGSADGNIYCLNASTGAYIWSYTTGSSVYSSPAVAYGKVFVGSGDFKVYCLDALTGAHIWSYTTGSSLDSSPAVADGKVFVGSYDNKVYCLNASTGAYIWSYTTGDWVSSSPAVADGVVYVGSDDNVVYAFGNVARVPEDYPTIQDAINNATAGATIIISPGTYNESIVINKTLTIIGLPGSTTNFTGGGSGIAVTLLPGASGSILAGITITDWNQGILVVGSSNCKIYDNAFQQNSVAINLTQSSTRTTIYANTISQNNIGITLTNSNGNTIYNNNFANNSIGITLTNSNVNIIYNNNFVNNSIGITLSNSAGNIWDNGYPSGGNYWSDYTGVDEKSGPNQDQSGSDGIGDTPYTRGGITDRYPLMNPWQQQITQPSPPVGGISIPVDKFALLAPYIALASTIILAIAVTAVFVKYKKKRANLNLRL